jgi:hypothetical protein
MGAAGADTAAGVADLHRRGSGGWMCERTPVPTGRRRTPRHATPPITRSQRPATNRDPTSQVILERPWLYARPAGETPCARIQALHVRRLADKHSNEIEPGVGSRGAQSDRER